MAETGRPLANEQSPMVIESPITVRADRAWEGETDASGSAVLHLEGSFEMRTADWRATAHRAEVHGPVEDPHEVVIVGAPARIWFQDDDGAASTGQGGRIVYRRREELLELYDDAMLEGEELSMTSSAIVYDLKKRRLRSSGTNGIEITLKRGEELF